MLPPVGHAGGIHVMAMSDKIHHLASTQSFHPTHSCHIILYGHLKVGYVHYCHIILYGHLKVGYVHY